MNKFSRNVQLYKNADPDGSKSVEELSQHLGWSKQMSYYYKYFISELDIEGLELLDKAKSEIDPSLVAAVCVQHNRYKLHLLKNIDRINEAASPFTEIDLLITEVAGTDPLTEITNDYWIEVGNYLTIRRINQHPFTKNAIGFIKNIGFKGYQEMSTNQKKWIIGLIQEDKKRPEDDRFFINEHMIQKGYRNDCATIEKYEPCP